MHALKRLKQLLEKENKSINFVPIKEQNYFEIFITHFQTIY